MADSIVLGVCGGIAAVKVPDLINKLVKKGQTVDVIMTSSAVRIISPQEISSLTGRPVYTDLFGDTFNPGDILTSRRVEHIDLADSAGLLAIVPATANVMAKLACGIADDYLTTTALAVTCPILVAPSMNVHMWQHPQTQENAAKLRLMGVNIAGPDSGMLACGYTGEGRLMHTGMLADTILSFASVAKPLAGKKILVTAGGTIEPIDGVRAITNRSSGKMGVALAEACRLAGAQVLLLRSGSSVIPRIAVQEEIFDTADSLEELMRTYAPSYDICIHAAAVSDFRISRLRGGKTSSTKPLALELEPRHKILEKIKTYNPGIFLVAFKAEWNVSQQELVRLAKQRLYGTQTDLIVANDVGKPDIGFQSDENEVTLIDPDGGAVSISRAHKQIIARQIVSHIAQKISAA